MSLTVVIQGLASSPLSIGSSVSLGPISVIGSAGPVVQSIVLGPGSYAVNVPAGSVGVYITPPQTNNIALKYKALIGSGGTVTLTAASSAVTATAIGVGGTGYPASDFFLATPYTLLGTGCKFLVTTNSSGVATATTFLSGVGGSAYNTYTGTTVPFVIADEGVNIPPALPSIQLFDTGNLPTAVYVAPAAQTSGFTQFLFF